jgi:flavin-dependent dehydrogenase
VLPVEVLIVGAGPAGATIAINLAPFRHVLLIDRKAGVAPRVGESLVPAAKRLLGDMGLWKDFIAEGHEPWYGNRSVWGGPEPRESDFLRDPDGHGWHLDRFRFESWLRAIAQARGAQLLLPSTLTDVERDGDKWRVLLSTEDGPLVVLCNQIVDATGRTAPVGRRLGAITQADDRLICAWVYGCDRNTFGRGLTYIEAVEDGWWYTSPLPRGQRVLAFHTDADLPSVSIVRERNKLLEYAKKANELSTILSEAGFTPGPETGASPANGASLKPPVGNGWLAIGDAAISFDPISSQGLLNALFTGLAAAETVHRQLEGELTAIFEYQQFIQNIRDAYLRHVKLYYALEKRWISAPFWQRRCPNL